MLTLSLTTPCLVTIAAAFKIQMKRHRWLQMTKRQAFFTVITILIITVVFIIITFVFMISIVVIMIMVIIIVFMIDHLHHHHHWRRQTTEVGLCAVTSFHCSAAPELQANNILEILSALPHPYAQKLLGPDWSRIS